MAPVVGFVGLGQMGAPMARRAAAVGMTIEVHDARREAAEELQAGDAVWRESPSELGRTAEIVVVMVPSGRVEQVLLGDSGLAHAAHPGLIVIEGGNSDPAASRSRATALAAAGIRMLDIGFSGGPQNALTGDLAVMAGGDRAAFDQALPLLRAFGREIEYFGDSGAGHLAKALNHLVQGITAQAIGEALAIARAAGIDAGRWVEVVAKGAAGSWLMDRTQEMLSVEDFPGMDDWWDGLGTRNQLTYSLEAADAAQQPVPLTALAHQLRTRSTRAPRSDALENYVRLTWAFSHGAGHAGLQEVRGP
jgi:3-hydroxyisobutyrate dehydrogenase-like beta-hydroxyacid dehydrogenase